MNIQGNRCVPTELATHEDYLQLLDRMEQQAAYVMLVQICGPDPDDPVVCEAEASMTRLEQQSVQEWPGTVTLGQPGEQYVYAASEAFFQYLRQFPAFFFRFTDSWGCGGISDTGFGDDDIAFLDQAGNLLFYTTTHEGLAYQLER